MFEIIKSDKFAKWIVQLKDRKAKSLIFKRIARLEAGNFGDTKSVGDGVYEARIHFGAGYRIYYSLEGLEVIILLIGGNKSSQSRDIEKAIEIQKEWKND